MSNYTVSLKLDQLESELREYPTKSIIKMIKSDYLKSVTDAIRTESDKERRSDLKNKLPLVFFNNKFHDTNGGASLYKAKDNYGVMVMDLDDYDDIKVKATINQLMDSALWAYVLFMFRSPSGGLKFAIKTDVAVDDNDFHKEAYYKVTKLLVKIGVNAEFDSKCCNINRGTYICHDGGAHYNDNCLTLPMFDRVKEAVNERKRKEQAEIEQSKIERQFSSGIDTDRARKWYEKEVQAIIDRTVSGFRHSNAYVIASTAFGIGLDEADAIYGLQCYKFAGLYVDSMSIENKVREVKQHWQANGARVSNAFLKRTTEQLREYLNTLFQ